MFDFNRRKDDRQIKPISSPAAAPQTASITVNPEQDYLRFHERSSHQYIDHGAGRSVTELKTAVLHIFSPRRAESFTVRPHIHDFTPATQAYIVDRVQNNPSVSPSYADTNDYITTSIKPTNDYKYTLDMKGFNDCWSFVLVFDEVDTTTVHNMDANPPVNRYVIMGMILDEPLSLQGSPNPRAVLQLTKVNCYRINTRRVDNGVKSLYNLTGYDVVNPTTDNLLREGMPTARLTPSAYFGSTTNTPRLSGDGSDLRGVMVPAIKIPTRIHTQWLSPHQEMLMYLDAIQSGRDVSISAVELPDREMNAHRYLRNPEETLFQSSLQQKSFHSDTVSCHHRLLEGTSVSIGELLSIMPHCEIQPYHIPREAGYDTYPSHANKLKNIYHAWITDVVHYLVKEYGIVDLRFDYNTRTGNLFERTADLNQRTGAWKLTSMNTVAQMTSVQLSSVFNMMCSYLETVVFRHLKTTVGDFMLSVTYVGSAPTVVFLHFYDSVDHDAGSYYSSPVQLGGYCSPSVGDVSSYANNNYQIQSLVQTCANAISYGI